MTLLSSLRRGKNIADDGRVYLDNNSLAQYMAAFKKDGYKLDTSLYTLSLSGLIIDNTTRICRDTDHAYILSKKHNLGPVTVALIGFDIESDVAYVKQIQGAFSRRYALEPLRWERMLLKIILDEVSEEGFSQVRIQPAEKNNYWDKAFPDRREMNMEKHRKRLKIRYNVTARRSGFRFDEQLGCYVLDL